jgi:VanZ like protein/concanavalin A-like lectin/glucanase superfamily protein
MNKAHLDSAHAKIVSLLCLFVLGSIAVAGLWPFHVPRNAVSWLTDKDGLRFSGHGSAASAGAFRSRRPPNDTGCSLEILLKPARTTASGSILAFDSSTDPRVPFLLRQYGTSLAVLRYLVDEHGQVTRPWYKVDQVLEAGKQVLVTVTSGKDNVALYVNGVLARRFSDSGIASGELTGQLVLANSTVDDSWRGEIMGLAIYSRELTPGQVREHSQSWTRDQEPLSAGEQALTARYLFNERDGNIVHNQVDPATNLIVPAKYFVLHPAFLRPTWAEYAHAGSFWRRWSFWEDLGVNVCGFVPVGFVFFAYFSAVRRLRRPALMAVLMGLFLSCSVEVLQRLLPNRDSGMTDLLTNTTGTALGVLLYRSSYVQDLWMKALEFGARILQCGVTKRGRQHSTCLGRASKVIVAGHSVDTQT